MKRIQLNHRGRGPGALLVLGLLLGLAACYPGGPQNLDDLGLVLSVRNPDVSFAGLETYGMRDTVYVLSDSDDVEPLDPRFDATILAALQRNMADLGFVREPDPDTNQPDVWLEVGTVKSDVLIYWYDWGYWGGYYYYPPIWNGVNFEQGTILWQLVDLRGFDPGDDGATAPVMWVAGINGALDDSNNVNDTKIGNGIDQAFAQSPYVIAAPPTKADGGEVAR